MQLRKMLCFDFLHVPVAGFNELRIKDKLIKEIVIKESAKKIQVINDVGKKGIWQKTMQTIKETSIFEISKYGIW